MTTPHADAIAASDDAIVRVCLARSRCTGGERATRLRLTVDPGWRGDIDDALARVRQRSRQVDPRRADKNLDVVAGLRDAAVEYIVLRYLRARGDPPAPSDGPPRHGLGPLMTTSLSKRVSAHGRAKLVPMDLQLGHSVVTALDRDLSTAIATRLDAEELAVLGSQPLHHVRSATVEALTTAWARWRQSAADGGALASPSAVDSRRRGSHGGADWRP